VHLNSNCSGLDAGSLTLPSDPGDTGNVAWGFFMSSSDEHSEQTKWSNFFASSIVMPTQAGWYLQKTYQY